MEHFLKGALLGVFFLIWAYALPYLSELLDKWTTEKTSKTKEDKRSTERYNDKELRKTLKELGKLTPGDKVPVGILWSCMPTMRTIVEGHVLSVSVGKNEELQQIKVTYNLDDNEVTKTLTFNEWSEWYWDVYRNNDVPMLVID